MASNRGAVNLERFNAERSAQLVPLLARELQLCRKRKLEFKSVGLLAAYLSDRLKVHRTTFLRNLNYRTTLLEYLSLQPGAVTRTPDTTLDPAILQAKLVSARLEASNLRQDIKRLSAQVAGHRHTTLSSDGTPELDFANLAMLMVNVMVRMEDTIVVDYDRRSIVDLAAKPSERVVAGPERAGPFISWLEQNQAVPGVRLLKKVKGISK
jgi:hypothetical protein